MRKTTYPTPWQRYEGFPENQCGKQLLVRLVSEHEVQAELVPLEVLKDMSAGIYVPKLVGALRRKVEALELTVMEQASLISMEVREASRPVHVQLMGYNSICGVGRWVDDMLELHVGGGERWSFGRGAVYSIRPEASLEGDQWQRIGPHRWSHISGMGLNRQGGSWVLEGHPHRPHYDRLRDAADAVEEIARRRTGERDVTKQAEEEDDDIPF